MPQWVLCTYFRDGGWRPVCNVSTTLPFLRNSSGCPFCFQSPLSSSFPRIWQSSCLLFCILPDVMERTWYFVKEIITGSHPGPIACSLFRLEQVASCLWVSGSSSVKCSLNVFKNILGNSSLSSYQKVFFPINSQINGSKPWGHIRITQRAFKPNQWPEIPWSTEEKENTITARTWGTWRGQVPSVGD